MKARRALVEISNERVPLIVDSGGTFQPFPALRWPEFCPTKAINQEPSKARVDIASCCASETIIGMRRTELFKSQSLIGNLMAASCVLWDAALRYASTTTDANISDLLSWFRNLRAAQHALIEEIHHAQAPGFETHYRRSAPVASYPAAFALTGTDPEPGLTGTDPEPGVVIQVILTYLGLA